MCADVRFDVTVATSSLAVMGIFVVLVRKGHVKHLLSNRRKLTEQDLQQRANQRHQTLITETNLREEVKQTVERTVDNWVK